MLAMGTIFVNIGQPRHCENGGFFLSVVSVVIIIVSISGQQNVWPEAELVFILFQFKPICRPKPEKTLNHCIYHTAEGNTTTTMTSSPNTHPSMYINLVLLEGHSIFVKFEKTTTNKWPQITLRRIINVISSTMTTVTIYANTTTIAIIN